MKRLPKLKMLLVFNPTSVLDKTVSGEGGEGRIRNSEFGIWNLEEGKGMGMGIGERLSYLLFCQAPYLVRSFD